MNKIQQWVVFFNLGDLRIGQSVNLSEQDIPIVIAACFLLERDGGREASYKSRIVEHDVTLPHGVGQRLS